MNPEVLAIMIPIVALMIPIVAILTKHQQRMAEMMHIGANQQQSQGEIMALRKEVHELRQLVHQQTISIDNLVSRPVQPTPDISQRLGN